MSDAFPDLNHPSEPTAATPAAPTAASASTPPTPSGATAASGTTAAPSARTRRPLFGTILWGVILLSFAAFMVITTLFPVNFDPTLWLVGSVIVIGLLLVVAGIAAASRRAG